MMIKKGSINDITDFLQMLNKLSGKKRRQININKQNASIEKTSFRKTTIGNLNNPNKKELLVSISAINES